MRIFKKIISIFFRIGISAALIIFLFEQVDKKSLFGIVKNADKGFLILAFCVFSINYFLSLLRWEMLLKAVKIHLPFKRIIISYAGGLFFNLFLPSTIGGDFMRSIDLASHTKKPKEIVATVFLDRLSGYIGLVVLTLVSLSFGWKLVSDKSILLAVIIICTVLTTVLMVLFNTFLYARINKFLKTPNASKIRDAIKSIHEEIHIFRNRKKVIFYNLLVSILIQSVGPVTFFIIARAIGLKVDLVYFFIFLPIIGAITLLPISIGGLGLRDATTIFFFAKVGASRDLAFAMSLLNFSFILLSGAIGGLIYALTLHTRRLQYHK